jgi:hypothetical protein
MTNFASESEVIAVPEPAFTETWHPVSHGRVIGALEQATADEGIDVVSKSYSMSENGARMFGTWRLDAGNGRIKYELGFRNGLDKSMAIGICAGTCVLNCSNMCFSGDFIAFRMHTSGIDQDTLTILAREALGGALPGMDRLHEWQTGLNEIYVPQSDYKGLVYDMVTKNVFAGGQIKNYLTCLEEEKAITRGYALDGATSLYNVHGAATRLMRGWNLLRTSEATRQLNGVVDDYIEMKKAA